MKNLSYLLIVLLGIACQNSTTPEPKALGGKTSPTAISLFGDSLYAAEPSVQLLEKYDEKKENYESEPTIENLIWFGRFTAYKGDYDEAIKIYAKGIEAYPDDARLYRHRGHRYISVRAYDKAINDFKKAVALREGKENEIEPDGMPNAQNIPVSTLHGNIWYHLGLTYYLKGDFENALVAYQNCLASSTNDDNKVSSTHWIYMILRRLGRREEANDALAIIKREMNVIENTSYHKACLFYKGELNIEEIKGSEEDFSANDAINYAIGNWYYYNEDTVKAKEVFEKMLTSDGWNSFGYIAAEADMFRMQQ